MCWMMKRRVGASKSHQPQWRWEWGSQWQQPYLPSPASHCTVIQALRRAGRLSAKMRMTMHMYASDEVR